MNDNQKQYEYKVLTALCMQHLEEAINEECLTGWEPIGGPVVYMVLDELQYSQAVKRSQ